MPDESPTRQIEICFDHGTVSFLNVTDKRLHVDSTELEAEQSGRNWKKTYPEGQNGNGLDVPPDTDPQGGLTSSWSNPKETAGAVLTGVAENSPMNSEPIKLTVRAIITGRLAVKRTFWVQFKSGDLDEVPSATGDPN